MKKTNAKWMISVLAILLIVFPVLLEYSDLALSGDEVISYSMANNSDGGFVFSEGRVAGYLQEFVFAPSFSATVSNAIREAKDILQNRKQARFFTYDPDPEVRYYTHDEMQDWLEKRDGERFNVSTTWLYSLSDDANSYLYYCLLNVVCSVFPEISASKWSGFLLNYVLYLVILFLFYRLTLALSVQKEEGLVYTGLLGVSFGILSRLIYFRPYLLAMIFVLWLTILHVRIWNGMDKDRKRSFLILIPVIMLGYISHYTTAVVTASYALVTFFSLLGKKESATAAKYALIIVLSGILAVMIDPVSLAGLVSKSSGTSVTVSSFLAELYEYFLGSVFPGILFFLASLVLLAVFCRKPKDCASSSSWKMLGLSLLVFTIVILAGTKGARYLSVMTPVYILFLEKLLSDVVKNISERNQKTAEMITAVLIITFIVFNLLHSFNSLQEMNNTHQEIETAIKDHKADDCIFFRMRRAGYEYVPFIAEFRNAQVISVSTENWEELVDSKIFNNKELVLITEAYAKESFPAEWLNNHHFVISKIIYDSDGVSIVEAVSDK